MNELELHIVRSVVAYYYFIASHETYLFQKDLILIRKHDKRIVKIPVHHGAYWSNTFFAIQLKFRLFDSLTVKIWGSLANGTHK